MDRVATEKVGKRERLAQTSLTGERVSKRERERERREAQTERGGARKKKKITQRFIESSSKTKNAKRENREKTKVESD